MKQREWDWELHHMNSDNLGCRKLTVVEFILCCNLLMLKTEIYIKYYQHLSCVTDVVDAGYACLSLLVVMDFVFIHHV